MVIPDMNFRPLKREAYFNFTGPDPWENDHQTTWYVNGYQMETSSMTPPYPPKGIATQAVFVGIESCHGRYRILPMSLQNLWREGVLFQFQIKDDIKAARNEATRRTRQYVEEPKTSQQR